MPRERRSTSNSASSSFAYGSIRIPPSDRAERRVVDRDDRVQLGLGVDARTTFS
jgi:hypothetical protein